MEGKNELIEFIEEAEIQEQINKIKRQQEDEVRTTMKQRTGGEESQSSHWPGGEESQSSHWPEPRVKTLKIVKVEVEEEENYGRFMKTLVAAVGCQLLLNWLYGKCQKRLKGQKKSQEVEEETDEEDEDFEIVSAGTGESPEDLPKENEEPFKGKENEKTKGTHQRKRSSQTKTEGKFT